MIHKWLSENQEFFKSDDVVIEAGSYDGSDTAFLCELFFKGKVYGFEPIPSLFQKVKDRVKQYTNVEIYQKGLSSKNGKDTFYVSDINDAFSASSSILKPKDHLYVHKNVTFKTQIEIETVNLDDWCLEKNINHIAFLWLDIQGAEPIVLNASPRILKNTKYIFTEISNVELYEGVVQYPIFKEFLIKNNFEIVFEKMNNIEGDVLVKNKNF